ncbi:acyl-CoA dehydrogenase family protein [Noviherbaspirillum sp. Root189]|uniref:acyl-CoA dehydrogenase family protein n=1 Tax=Noviherbaspirillum sp. Root189 TaxID=1736487 RepID=UPI000708A5FD|nr:acyl-CoA dehydrogenase family protein [Noviherbaspirillum sp. Root189]KRB68006.1 acyl-CoA dehydrogenase [Noviherbaspirillum sp. Root189]
MFVEAIEDILKDQCTPAAVRAIEAGGSPDALWNAVTEAGFLELLASEEHGGAGLALAELFPILTTLGAYAMPVPLAQSIAARAVLAARTEIPSGMLTFAPALRRMENGRLICPLVPYGAIANHVIAQDGERVLVLPGASAVRTSTGVHGSLVASMSWEADVDAGLAQTTLAAGGLAEFGAALHAALLAGAMRRAFDMTLQYANDRSQFGKSIGKFQAIQHQISVMAEHVAASLIAAEAAFHGDARTPAPLASAIAKSRTSEAAVLVASIAHAVHGAIGVTEEYDLQLLTRRLHEWRIAHGSEAHWNRIVGQRVLQSGEDRIVDFIRSART